MPSTPLPGTGATMRMDRAFRARARSSANPVILLILTPRAGSSSKRLTTGPLMMAVTRPSTPKWRRVFSQLLGLGQHGVFLHLVIPGRQRVQEIQARQDIGPGGGRNLARFGAGGLRRRGCRRRHRGRQNRDFWLTPGPGDDLAPDGWPPGVVGR